MNIEAFFKITYGLYVVSARHEGKLSGYISNTVFQVTAEPPRFAIACNKNNFTAGLISQNGNFAVSVLKREVRADIMGTFGYRSGKDIDKFENFSFKTGRTGVPILMDDTVAWFECTVEQTVDTGSHLLFIGNVVDYDLLDAGAPLTYDYYREVKKGKAPKNAPTYIDPDKLVQKTAGPVPDKYYCTVCGYVYDPALGDPDRGILPGTRFEDLPEEWACPVCGTEQDGFTKVH